MKKSILAISILLSTSVMADYKVIMSGKSGNIQLPKQSAPSFSAHTFTNCGQTGRFGPSQSNCISEYNGSEILSPELSFSVTNGIQSFTIPFDGNYKIEAWGAKGGSIGGYSGGNGAKAEKTVTLNSGDEIKILVGQIGIGDGNGAGGGGGSYVIKNTTPLVIAGGGGGATSYGKTHGYPGRASTSGGDSDVNGYSCNGGGVGGGNGSGGTAGCAGGGAGWLGNGFTGRHSAEGGFRFSIGGQGGTSTNTNGTPHGGFGGGGAGSPSYGYGGGGGYSGGGGGSYKSDGKLTGNGGGGGSLGDNNQTGVNSGHGYVRITLIE